MIGFGSIGSACGRLAKEGFGTKVIGVDKYEISDPAIMKCANHIINLDQLPQALKEADYLLSVLPHTT